MSRFNRFIGITLAITTLSCTLPAQEFEASCDDETCDIFTSLRILLEDLRNVDLQDLLTAGVGFATDELNDAFEYLNVEAPVVYGLPQDSENDITVKNISALVSGLVTRFGRTELTTEVNQARENHLHQSDDRYFVESAVALKADNYWDWELKTTGFGIGDALKRKRFLGFSVEAEIKARIIAATKSESRGILNAPLAALRASRGFIVPRSIDDFRAMSPGESIAFSGEGSLGLNLGSGVPIFVAEPSSALTFSLVLSGALRALLEGTLDIQMVRMPNNEVVVDVGMEKATVLEASAALTPGWGVQGLVESKVKIESLGTEIDIGKVIDKGLRKRLDRKLALIKARAEKKQRATRLTVARIRFDLNQANPDLEQALAQAMRGDVRLAQGLSAKEAKGVRVEFDLSRSAISTTSHAGLDLLGMSFFKTEMDAEGSALLKTPGGSRSLLWDSRHRQSGWGVVSHGYTRVGLTGLTYQEESFTGEGEANLFIQLEESDVFLERDKLLDHVDPLLFAMFGSETFSNIASLTQAIEARIDEACPFAENFNEDCNISLIEQDLLLNTLKTEIQDTAGEHLQALNAQSNSDHQLGDVASQLLNLKIAAQSIQDPPAYLSGPDASIVSDIRWDDAALETLFGQSQEAFENALSNYVLATNAKRLEGPSIRYAQPLSTDDQNMISAIGRVFSRHAAHYRELLNAEDGIAQIDLGVPGYERAPVDILTFSINDNEPIDSSITVNSSARRRSDIAIQLFDQLFFMAGELSGVAHPEQCLAYTFFSLLSPQHMDMRVDFKTDNTGLLNGRLTPRRRYDAAGFQNTDVYGRGSAVSKLFGGMFNIDEAIAPTED